ncbi:MAG: hypothetical protein V1777_03995 [Candidatus Micrarchaeota archaeon]
MSITLTLPGLGIQGLSTKDAIISILSNRWPLSLKQIHQIAKTEYAISATYQAVHKMIGLLVSEKVVVRGEEGYCLNSDWISRIKSFSEQLGQNYAQESPFKNFQNQDIINLRFDSLLETIRFIVHKFNWEFPNPEKKPRIAMLMHAWMPIGADEKDFEQIKRIFELPYYGLYRGNTPLDHYGNQFVVKLGKKSIYGVNYPAEGDIVVEGDYVAQIFYPLELKTKINAIFAKTKNIDTFDLAKLFEIYTQKSQIKVVISRNPELARNLREEGIKLYQKYWETHGPKSPST